MYEECKILASMVVFRELYDSEKDIYGIIGEFLRDIIYSHSLRTFSVIEIMGYLKEEYGFDNIPDSVVKSALKRLNVSKSNGEYTVLEINQEKENTILARRIETNTKNDIILGQLISFIELNKKETLDSLKKEKVIQEFLRYLLDESGCKEYGEYISAFIISLKQDGKFISELNTIKEGIVLYEGLKYNSSVGEIGNWTTSLNLYLETDILFSLAGYNGSMYKEIFDELYSFIREINTNFERKNAKERIRLFYFPEVREEVDNYFNMAENIIANKTVLNPSQTAMVTIVKGCKTKADVIAKKATFYKQLERLKIKICNTNDFYSENNHLYNIEDEIIINTYAQADEDKEYLCRCLKKINYINILRKNNNEANFQDIQHIILTGNGKILQLAFCKELKQERQTARATNIDYLINKFWFKLNKGFSNGNFPKTLNIITKAQIIMSSQINNSVARKYDEVYKKCKSGEIQKEDFYEMISRYRQEVKLPEEIVEIEIENDLQNIVADDLEKYIQEREYQKQLAKDKSEEVEKLKSQLLYKDEVTQDLQSRVSRYEQQAVMREEHRDRVKKVIKCILGAIIFIACIYITWHLYTANNPILGFITGTIGGILTILCFIGLDLKSMYRYYLRKVNRKENKEQELKNDMAI